jgi:alpha-beta hydrolase superfamily lysophospholipase
MGEWLARRGCAVHAYDHRGHGLSAGRANYVRSFDEYLDDLEIFLVLLRGECPDLPLVLVGHSMGALVVAKLLCERSPKLRCAVTSGAPLAMSPAMTRSKRILARVASLLVPTLATEAGLPEDGLSCDPEVARRYRADPLVNTKITASLAIEMMQASDATAAAAARVSVPLFMQHGGDDPICPAAGTEAFFAGVRAAGSDCKIYPKLRHEIYNEPEREQVYADLLAFVRKHEAEAGTSAHGPGRKMR